MFDWVQNASLNQIKTLQVFNKWSNNKWSNDILLVNSTFHDTIL